MLKNPTWTRDELILALDLYFRVDTARTSASSPEIIKLSGILNALPIFPDEIKIGNYRNPNGVYMKLCNFLRFDPDYRGKGLTAGGKLEEVIWNEYARNKQLLHETAIAIIKSTSFLKEQKTVETLNENPDEEFPEGTILTRVHKLRERNRALVSLKKRKVFAEKGKLVCEACGFDFQQFYGNAGRGFIECHHNRPLSEAAGNIRTSIEDLSLVCANCHRIIHRTRPWQSAKDLRTILEDRGLPVSATKVVINTQ